VLAAAQESGDGARGLIDAADAVARVLRDRAGESLKAVQNTPPLHLARTASLDALRAFSEGVRAQQVIGDNLAAIDAYRRAIAQDPLFAEAWRRLAMSTINSGAPRARADSAFERAYALRDRVSERERRVLEASYFYNGPGRDRLRAEAAYRETQGFGNNVGVLFNSRRDFARAESTYRAAIALDSTLQLSQGNLILTLWNRGSLRAADSAIQVTRRRFPTSDEPVWTSVVQRYQRGDLVSYARALDSALAGARGATRANLLSLAEGLALLRGRVADWQRLRAQRDAADAAVGRVSLPAERVASALRVFRGTLGRATLDWAALDTALARAPMRAMAPVDRPDLAVAADLAWAGQPTRARALIADWQASVRDTALRRDQLPALRTAQGAIAVAEGRHAEAIALLRKGDSLPDGPVDDCTICLPLALGRAFDAAGQSDSAIVQFERYLSTPYSRRGDRLHLDPASLAPVHERLGQLYEAQGNVAKALEHDRAFVALWAGADAELQPRVAAARARIARLAPVEPRRP
jgi:tetratricopeptide (TPR) repeat protein